MTHPKRPALRFRITLEDIEPPIWRLIEVPVSYNFWDLHVAIQDAMGWLDYHLHAFRAPAANGEAATRIGIPDEEFDDGTVAGWEVPVAHYFKAPGDSLLYEYDFGDDWRHRIEWVERTDAAPQTLPRCIAGARACPPEDVGGIPGYLELLEILADRSHPEHDSMVQWLQGHAVNYHPFRSEHFDPAAVDFTNPKERFRIAFERS